MQQVQLNYNNINIADYSQDVLEKYAFPSDKNHLLRIMRGERTWSQQELKNNYDQATNDAVYSTISLCIGSCAFVMYMMPGGKVLRDRYGASMTPTRRLFRRFVPFAGIALPIYILRQRLDASNGYIE